MAVWIGIIGVIFSHILLIVLVVAWWRVRERQLQTTAEVQTRLIERFGSASELAEFLQSPSGRAFLQGVQTGNTLAAGERYLSGVRKAIVLAFLGSAFMAFWGIFGEDGFAIPGLLLLTLGGGYLVAAFVTRRLARELVAGPADGGRLPET